tara:strand:- start:1148 stop:1603 length:456 start_codon:yes stop_codon:yes gene_type:complete
MRKYFYILIFIPFLILGCDYTPIYSNKDNYNFFIEKIEFNGDAEINNLIDKKLKKYRTAKSEKKISISSTSSYNKVSQSKNLSGKTTNYLVIIEITFQIQKDDQINTFKFNEDFLIKNFSNKFEENNLEKIKKENSTDQIINRLISQISRM